MNEVWLIFGINCLLTLGVHCKLLSTSDEFNSVLIFSTICSKIYFSSRLLHLLTRVYVLLFDVLQNMRRRLVDLVDAHLAEF